MDAAGHTHPSSEAAREVKAPRSARRTVLILSQVYVPDPAAVGQQIADAAVELARRGHRVIVLTANRGYDDPGLRYPSRELLDGVEVYRLPLSSFGKSSIGVRLLGGILFMLHALLRGMLVRKLDTLLVSTSPPMASAAAVAIAALRRVRVTYWVMDLNPDQIVALGMVRAESPSVRVFEWLNRSILRRADKVVVLDRYMAERVTAKLDVRHKMCVLPPWPHEDHLESIEHEANLFRERHELQRRFVFMYSGNHGPSNPLTTFLQAALRLRDVPDAVFLFVGGGVGKREVEAVAGERIRSLPYQPLAELRYSLSAADVHVVTMGDDVVGIVHPCKIYGAMAVGRPVLLFGPSRCHVADILADERIGWHVPHGDVDAAERVLREIVRTSPSELRKRGERARALIAGRYSKAYLCTRFCDVVEGRLALGNEATARASLAVR